MNISVDNESNFVLKSNPATLADVLIELTQYVQSKGKAIQSIRVDSENLSPEALGESVSQRLVADVESIDIETVSLTGLLTDTLDEITAVIGELPVACHELAQVLSGDTPSEATEFFHQFIAIWAALVDRQTQVLSMLTCSAQSIRLPNGTNLADQNAALDERLKQAQECMNDSKFPELADLLSHELFELAQGEQDVLDALRMAVEAST